MIVRPLAISAMLATLLCVAPASAFIPAELAFDKIPEGADEVAVEFIYTDLTQVIPSIIVGEKIYIRMTDIFSVGGVKCELAADKLSFEGFFLQEHNSYKFDASNRTFACGDGEWKLTPQELLLLEGGGYFEIRFLETALKVKLEFSYASLSLLLVSEVALPVVELSRRNKSKKAKQTITAGERAEYYYPLRRRWISAGALDYSFSSSYDREGYSGNYAGRFGAQILGGDLETSYSGSVAKPFDWREGDYKWRYHIGSSVLTEILVGNNLGGGAVRTPADSGIGVRLSNRSNEFRNSFSTYKINERTEPRWTVELYLNGLLIDFTTADDDGYYSFEIPLGYGSSEITQKFYGAFGELRIEESSVNVPYSFMPPGEIEYNLTGSSTIEIPTLEKLLGKADLKLGVSSFLTIGGGVSYDPRLVNQEAIRPFGDFSLRPFSDLLISGTYFHKAGFDADFNWPLFWGIDLSGSYARPFANAPIYEGAPSEERRKLQVQMPFWGGNLRLMGIETMKSPSTSSADLSASISTSVFDMPIVISADGVLDRQLSHMEFMGASGRASLALQLLGMYVKPEVSYDIMKGRFTTASARMQLSFESSVFAGLGLNRDLVSGSNSGTLDFRFNLGALQLNAGSGISSQNVPSYNSSVSGAILIDPYTSDFAMSDRGSVGKGSAIVRAFIDTNDDGVYSDGETLVNNFDVSGAGNTTIIEGVGTRLDNLEPYSTRIVMPNLASVENIALLPKYKSIGIITPANGTTVIDFPMYIAGTVNGYVSIKKDSVIEPAAGVRILVMRLHDSTLLSFEEDFLTYESGEFFHVGLLPGKYAIAPDAQQLAKLKLEAEPRYREFYLRSIEEGDMIENLNFDIIPAAPGSLPLAFGKQAAATATTPKN